MGSFADRSASIPTCWPTTDVIKVAELVQWLEVVVIRFHTGAQRAYLKPPQPQASPGQWYHSALRKVRPHFTSLLAY